MEQCQDFKGYLLAIGGKHMVILVHKFLEHIAKRTSLHGAEDNLWDIRSLWSQKQLAHRVHLK